MLLLQMIQPEKLVMTSTVFYFQGLRSRPRDYRFLKGFRRAAGQELYIRYSGV